MRVDQLWRYPVKSMIGEQVPEVQVAERGVVGDRTWAARDQVRGGIRGAKVLGGLMRLAARAVDGGHAVITLPDGTEVATSDPDVHARVSEAIDHEVVLEALRPPEDRDHFRRGEPYHDDLMDELNAIFGREEGEPLPDLSVFPPEILELESPAGTYHDAFPLMLMSTSAFAELEASLPDSAIDVRRFRPSLVVDTGGEPGHPEKGWVGRRLRIGGAEVELVTGCPRCVMVTREVSEDLPQDRRILRHIVSELGQDVGVYAEVVQAGPIRVGDPVELLEG